MTDKPPLLERLRTKYCCTTEDCNCDEAADRITELMDALRRAQGSVHALKKAERALSAFMERYQSGFRADTEYVADLVRKALEALEQSK
jgi:hypothetical protein